ncbi:hypothetical protein [Microcystis phage Mel-JY01]
MNTKIENAEIIIEIERYINGATYSYYSPCLSGHTRKWDSYIRGLADEMLTNGGEIKTKMQYNNVTVNMLKRIITGVALWSMGEGDVSHKIYFEFIRPQHSVFKKAKFSRAKYLPTKIVITAQVNFNILNYTMKYSVVNVSRVSCQNQ